MIRKAFEFIHGRMARAARWLGQALSEGDGSPSSKRLFFGASVFSIIAFCSFEVIKQGKITPAVIQLSTTLLGVTATAYGVTRVWADKKEDPAIAAGTTEAPRV
jgi:hypothetical protein